MEIPKAYEPQSVEAKWYAFWEQHGCFTADPARVSARRPAYSIVIPPPNVTGVLTLGHVLNNTIQDILARKARMEGREVLWLPGTDHAGIATQNVVEKSLKKSGEMRHRDDLGRDALVAKIWEWKETYGGIILKQLRALGASCDWTRTRFTMDPEYSRCVQRVFVDLYRKGLIYRGKRMVNWCPASLTALSDEEVVMKEQKGFLYHVRVEVVEEPGTYLTFATTRPETIPADAAVAVHPKDPRYQHLIGKQVYRALPLEVSREQRVIPRIADEHVAFDFGTGVLKVTPADDEADFEIGLRHRLPVVDVLTPDGRMSAAAGADLAGLARFAGRAGAAELLEAAGTLEKAEPYVNHVGFSERADVPIEPRLSEQWFLKYPAVEQARACVAPAEPNPDSGAEGFGMRFFPDRWAKVYDHWMGGIQDWCISRQLWWGHRIPVWYRVAPDSGLTGQGTSGDEMPLRPVEERCQVECPGAGWIQDPDVLDTWFSSWLWPFATLGWTGDPDTDSGNATLKAFYPTTDLVTAPDIIFFWVARMIMAGYEYMGEAPFRNVYFTGIIRDKQGRKMSKSLGNSPDPLDLIAAYGADALRFGVMRSAPLGQDIRLDEKSVELGRNFCNKLWNACRFRQMAGSTADPGGEIVPERLTNDDRWILLRLDQAIGEVHQAFTSYRFNEATATLYRFFWSEYCDWYVEASKAALQGGDPALRANKLAVMDFVLGHLLRLFHPFLPFITEELWHALGFSRDLPADQGGLTLMTAPWPRRLSDAEKDYFGLDEAADRVAQATYDLVTLGRSLRLDARVDGAKKVRFVLRPSGIPQPGQLDVLKALLNAETLGVEPSYAPPKGTPMASNALGELFLPLEGLMDVAAERMRLTREHDRIVGEIAKVEAKLSNPAFTQKVPAAVLDEHRQRLADWEFKRQAVRSALGNLPE